MARILEIPLLRQIIQILCLVLFSVGIAIFSYGMLQAYFAYRSNSWPSTSGIVNHAKLVYKKGIMRTKGRSLQGTYLADLGYEYSVQGIIFNNDNICYGYRGDKKASVAKDLLQKYPVGNGVTVYYQKDNPAHSVLEPGIKVAVWNFPIMGLFFLLVAQLGYSLGIRKYLSRKS